MDARLWQEYHDEGSEVARERLIEDNLRLVHFVARKVHKRLQADTEFDDLVSAGTFGLLSAIDNFEPERGLSFSTFAAPRIRGAILDHLRQWDHAPRSVRRRQREVASAREQLSGTMMREPSSRETANALGIDVDTYWRWESASLETNRVALDAPVPNGHGRMIAPADRLSHGSGDEIELAVNQGEEIEILKSAIEELPDRERLVLTLYYYEELKMHEIAEVLGVTESRISQIRSKALGRLRSDLGHLREDVQA